MRDALRGVVGFLILAGAIAIMLEYPIVMFGVVMFMGVYVASKGAFD